MGILFLTVKQERCSDSLLWSAAWLLPPLRLMPMLTTATAMALATEDLATPVSDTLVSDTATALATATQVLDTLTARGRLRPSLRLMLSTDMELTPTPLDTATPPLPRLPLTLSLPLPSPPLPSATPVSDTLVSDTPVSATALATATLVLDTPTARGRPRLSPRLMLTTATELTPTLLDTVTPVSATLPPTATATVLEPTELTELTTVKLVQLRAAEAQHNLYRQFSFHRSRTPCAVRRERILFSLIVW